MHEKFQELCSVASIGQASREELALLERHLVGCEVCRQAYSQFTNIAAQEYGLTFDESLITRAEAQQLPDAGLLQQRFLKRAAETRILELPPNERSDGHYLSSPSEMPSDTGHSAKWKQSLYLLAAVLVVSLSVLCGYKIGRRHVPAESVVATASVNDASQNAIAVPMAQLTDLNVTLEAEVAALRKDLEMARAKWHDTQEVLSSVSEEKQILANKQGEQNDLIDRLQRKLDETEALLNAAKQETARLQSSLGDAQTSSVANQVRIRELTDELSEKVADLNRDQQLLQRDRDIRDLMVARNLHIFDVFDTDTKGKTSPAFGRIFYTEGKSLIFYAYDLNDVRVHDAAYHYRVWGAKEGQDDKATSLGIFYSDDKSQRRWVFKCDDPRILRQIDSVFVTVEPVGGNPAHPKGQKLLDAYLRGVPNHP